MSKLHQYSRAEIALHLFQNYTPEEILRTLSETLLVSLEHLPADSRGEWDTLAARLENLAADRDTHRCEADPDSFHIAHD